jgi:hypothetical protein
MAEKPLTSAEARLLSVTCREWPKGRQGVTRSANIQWNPIFNSRKLPPATRSTATRRFNWRVGVRVLRTQTPPCIVKLVEHTYWLETGRHFADDIVDRPRTVAKWFDGYAKHLEK